MSEVGEYPKDIDLSSCENEPIHIIGKSQSHGVIVACDMRNCTVVQISANCKDILGLSIEDILGNSLDLILGDKLCNTIVAEFEEDSYFKVHQTKIGGKSFFVVPHISDKTLLLDIEPKGEEIENYKYQKQLTSILSSLSSVETAEKLCERAASLTRDIFGYDRVMVYKFDEEWNGKVIAEEKNEEMESWLGLHYPASDIPKQARELFFKNKIRIITDVNSKPIALVPEISPISEQALDLSGSLLRAVSPIHIEYLQNMNVGASLTAALIANGKLWGLIACHHNSAKFINFYQRQTCDFLTQIFSNELSLKNTRSFLENIEKGKEIRQILLQQVNRKENIRSGLTQQKSKFTDLIQSGGGAIILNKKITLVGNTPSKSQVKTLLKEFVFRQKDSVFFTNNLMSSYPEAKEYKDVASGFLSIKLGESERDALIWFRPEVIQTVSWGGNPENKALYSEEKQRLTPRKSFEIWTQELKGYSQAWLDYEISEAKSLRESISYVILNLQKKEINRLNNELIDAHNELNLFSQGLSHDLKAPLRGIDGYAHILKEDHYTGLEAEAKMAVDTILTSAEEMQDLIDNILSFAGVNNQNLKKVMINTDHLIQELLKSFNIPKNYFKTELIIEEQLPKMLGDKQMLAQVWSNLITNALKYSEKEKSPKIEIGTLTQEKKTVYYVKDNGIGFDQKYSEEIFVLFSRFSGNNYSGTGIGLAIVKKIIEKHDGKIWAESNLGEGTSFYFHL
ncbi:ATP-binding protein [Gramella sp. AN32]|uniref:histidine kinase n=1 Tax=Christiangramia antarctica TaxID=2058158 RepID=A0ABW5X256_9FLAO|nr:ATP-binding protein [Gramella sp. AN32]MCM4157078.1 histidine kinase [Gramella sp. AN32]